VPESDEKAALNPFPGPRPFTEGDADVFFGREREVEHLLALLVVERAVLVHAPSGSGKSSLINASLIPRARARGFHVLPVARVRDPLGATREPSGTANRYVSNVLHNWREEATLREAPEATTLVEFLSALGRAHEPGRLIVLDQFEELFLYPESWRDRAEVFRQIQAALDRDRLLRALFVVRDDYLARLEPFTSLLCGRLRTRYPIRGLDHDQALAATVEPFRKAGMHFAPGAGEAIVRDLLLQPADDPTAPRYEGEHVEPVQLQIVCRTLFERLAEREPPVDEITNADVDTDADVDQALAGFYDQAVAAATKTSRQVNERQIRLWFERKLITPSRARNRVLREAQETGGLRNDVVDELEQRRVVHSDPRGPDRWYELTHDRFVDAVLSSNRAWFTSPAGRDRRALVRAVIAGGLVPAFILCGLLLVRSREPARGEEFTKAGAILSADDTQFFPISGKRGQLLTATLQPQSGLKGHLELFGTSPDPVATSADSIEPDTAQDGASTHPTRSTCTPSRDLRTPPCGSRWWPRDTRDTSTARCRWSRPEGRLSRATTAAVRATPPWR
jgi:conflict system STAND superfamily ATPase